MQAFPIEFLNSLTPGGMAPHVLNLKENARVMLLRNNNIKNGFCNGTMLKVIRCLNSIIICQNITNNQRIMIHRMPMTSDETGFPFRLKRIQLPIRLSYCITINKSQGSTFDRVGIYLPVGVFDHGQFYTAVSRVRSEESLKVLALNRFDQGTITNNPNHVYVKNIVYREVLLGNLPQQPLLPLEQDDFENENPFDNINFFDEYDFEDDNFHQHFSISSQTPGPLLDDAENDYEFLSQHMSRVNNNEFIDPNINDDQFVRNIITQVSENNNVNSNYASQSSQYLNTISFANEPINNLSQNFSQCLLSDVDNQISEDEFN